MNRDKATRLVQTIIDSYVEASGETPHDTRSFAAVLDAVKTDLVGLVNEIFDHVKSEHDARAETDGGDDVEALMNAVREDRESDERDAENER